MTDFIEVEKEIKKYLSYRYSQKTVNLYAKRFLDLIKYYPATDPIDLKEEEINKYTMILVDRKVSRSLIDQYLQVIEYYYNHIHKKSYIFSKKNLPKRVERKMSIID